MDCVHEAGLSIEQFKSKLQDFTGNTQGPVSANTWQHRCVKHVLQQLKNSGSTMCNENKGRKIEHRIFLLKITSKKFFTTDVLWIFVQTWYLPQHSQNTAVRNFFHSSETSKHIPFPQFSVSHFLCICYFISTICTIILTLAYRWFICTVAMIHNCTLFTIM